MRGLLRDTRGAVAIEFAAIAVPFILLLAGTMEISRYTWTRVALQDSASAGARCLGLRLAPCVAGDTMDRGATVAFVRQQARAWGITVSGASVTPSGSATCHALSDFARVRVTHRFSSVLGAFPDKSIEVEACFPARSSS